jgi:hypothetical protein
MFAPVTAVASIRPVLLRVWRALLKILLGLAGFWPARFFKTRLQPVGPGFSRAC